jgi:MFS family permease
LQFHGILFVFRGSGVVQSVSQAITVKVTPPHRLGLANSTLFICMDIGLDIGPFTFGLFVPFAGYRGVYGGAAIGAFVCTLLYYMLHGKRAAIEKAEFSLSALGDNDREGDSVHRRRRTHRKRPSADA